MLGNAVDVSAVYGVGAILTLALFAPQILTLLAGSAFMAAAPALVIISFAIALAGMTHILRFALVACERPRLVLVADSTACVFAFAAYFSLIPRYSFIGAALGTVIAEVAALICMLYGLKRAGRKVPSFMNPAKAVVSGMVSVGAMILLDRFDLPWLLTLVIGGAIYSGGLALTRAIPLELVVNVLRRRVAYQGSA